jgi:type II secretory pathway pseudopilin PulG
VLINRRNEMKMMNVCKRQEGVSLLEAMLFLVIAGLVLMMALRYFTQSNEGQRINNAYDQHMGILSAHTAYVADGNPSDDPDVQALIDQKYLSPDSKTDPWGGTNELVVASGVPTITSTNVSPGSCEKLNSRIMNTVIGSSGTCQGTTLTVDYNSDEGASSGKLSR